MDLNDVRTFLVVARYDNLRTAAAELHQSPSALSKSIRRLESSLNTVMFDRIGKSLKLNQHGEHFRQRAISLISLADQTQAEFRGEKQQIHCRIVGPAILHWQFGTSISATLKKHQNNSGVSFISQYEDAAIASLVRGEADFALVTGVAVNATLPAGLEAIAMGDMRMQLAAGISHTLVQERIEKLSKSQKIKVKIADVLNYDFACPGRSLFCGIERGARSDGWRDDQLPRKIRYWLDDLQLLLTIVKSGQALAYLPDFAFKEKNLVELQVGDCSFECIEQVFVVWRPSTASGWQNKLIACVAKNNN